MSSTPPPTAPWLYIGDAGEIPVNEDPGDEEDHRVSQGYTQNFTRADHLALNRAHFDAAGYQRSPVANMPGKFQITSHSGSKIPSKSLYPRAYMDVLPINNLAELAGLLKVPAGWQGIIHQVLDDHDVQNVWQNFSTLGDNAAEDVVETYLSNLMFLVGRVLHMQVMSLGRVRYGVGGCLAYPDCAVAGITDYCYGEIRDKQARLCTELKRRATFTMGDQWYRSSRGCQVLSALFFTNLPTLLASQEHFKLLVEDVDRRHVFCYPAAETMIQTNEDEFIGALVLCLLSTRFPVTDRIPRIMPLTERPASESVAFVKTTPMPSGISSSMPVADVRRSARLARIREDAQRYQPYPKSRPVNSKGAGGDPHISTGQDVACGREMFFLSPAQIDDLLQQVAAYEVELAHPEQMPPIQGPQPAFTSTLTVETLSATKSIWASSESGTTVSKNQ